MRTLLLILTLLCSLLLPAAEPLVDFSSGDLLLNDGSEVTIGVSADDLKGVALAAGSGTWTVLSDRNAKADIVAVDTQDVLARVLALPLYTWRYR